MTRGARGEDDPQEGVWRGRRIIPAAWIEQSTRTYSVEDSASGVGYGCMGCLGGNTLVFNRMQVAGQSCRARSGASLHASLAESVPAAIILYAAPMMDGARGLQTVN
jgi:hypothetical protein